MNDEWFYESEGKQIGPVLAGELREKLTSGQISGQNLVWKEGMEDWTPIERTELKSEPEVPSSYSVAPAVPSPVFEARTARLNERFDFGFGELLGKGWRVLCADFWPMVGFYALVYLILSFAMNLVVTIFFITFPIMGGYYYYTLKRLRGEAGDIEMLFEGFKRRFGSLAMLSFLAVLPALAGMIPLTVLGALMVLNAENTGAIPYLGIVSFLAILSVVTIVGTVVMTVTWLSAILCLDCDIGWKASMKLAWTAYKRHFVKLTLFGLVAMFLMNLGALALVIGVFVTAPWITATYSALYEKAFGDSDYQAI